MGLLIAALKASIIYAIVQFMDNYKTDVVLQKHFKINPCIFQKLLPYLVIFCVEFAFRFVSFSVYSPSSSILIAVKLLMTFFAANYLQGMMKENKNCKSYIPIFIYLFFELLF